MIRWTIASPSPVPRPLVKEVRLKEPLKIDGRDAAAVVPKFNHDKVTSLIEPRSDRDRLVGFLGINLDRVLDKVHECSL